MIAFLTWLWSLLAMLTAQHAHLAPAAVVVPVPVVHVAPAPRGSDSAGHRLVHRALASPAAPAAPTVPVDPAHPELQMQLPNETDGRQIDCTDGVSVGVMRGGIVTGCPVTPTR